MPVGILPYEAFGQIQSIAYRTGRTGLVIFPVQVAALMARSCEHLIARHEDDTNAMHTAHIQHVSQSRDEVSD